ncbi:caspase, EACC1-associated type [Streptomyces cupreus]|uniref:Tetratricopeptide repeat protein n=1 Tax=Streptomyces cupreus TaxID=2759956 RepID=A0A7X1IYG9_9ACTN|nr:tetratricopeptide repeat protein [Streptomyces cupreus]MBC2900843.1 tetratricopeptide repeat protein [Streptomyces cupreus]
MAVEQSGSRAVLFGVHAYQHLPALDGVRHNVPALRDLLTAREAGGFAGEHCVAVPANSTPTALLDAVQDAADHARGLLLVYYAGHGHFGRDGRALLLATQASRPDRPHHSVPYDEIRAIVAASTARHRVVIVDCCFSGAALHMSGQEHSPAAPDFEIEGACVLTSSAETERSLCLPDGSVFTRELVLLLRDGLTGALSDGRRGEHLSLLTMADVYEALCERLKGRTVDGHRVPTPRMSTRDGGHRIPLAANRARDPRAASPRPSPPVAPVTAYAATRYFTGREDELAALAQEAGQSGAVCVVHGRGGQGKTELLRAAAARLASVYPAGCLEIDLRGWTPAEKPRDPHMVIAEQLHHMGYGPERVPTDLTARTETWRLFLKQHPVLLLLDNARDAAQLAPLLPPAGSPSAAMVSSRSELLDLNAHWRCALPPLPTEQCVTVWHKMGVPQDTEDLDRIAARINGSALALGPIGTRLLRGASPAAILAALAGPDRYTAFPSLDAAERAAFDSAYSALDTDLRNLIHQCAWHPGPDFAPDSLAAMAGRPEHEVEVRLTEIEQLLIRKNTRYSLHDSSLTYARRTAALHSSPEGEEASRQRLYQHLHSELQRARKALDSSVSHDERDARSARAWLDAHTPELQTAARVAGAGSRPRTAGFLQAVARSLLLDNRYIEAQELIQTVLNNTPAESLDHADATERLGEIHRMQGRFEDATAAYRNALNIYRTIGSQLGQANATKGLGDIHQAQGRYEQSARAYQDSLRLFQSMGDRVGQANAIKGAGDIHRIQGRYEEAATAYQDALALYRSVGNSLGQANTIKSLGDIHRMRGRHEGATTNYQNALTIFRTIGDRLGQANATKGLGDIHQVQGRYVEAAAAFEDALTIYRTIGDRIGEGSAIQRLGDIHQVQGRYVEAAAAFEDALTICRTTGDRLGQANAIKGLGDSHRACQRDAEAAEAFRTARDLYAEVGIAEWADICRRALDER